MKSNLNDILKWYFKWYPIATWPERSITWTIYWCFQNPQVFANVLQVTASTASRVGSRSAILPIRESRWFSIRDQCEASSNSSRDCFGWGGSIILLALLKTNILSQHLQWHKYDVPFPCWWMLVGYVTVGPKVGENRRSLLPEVCRSIKPSSLGTVVVKKPFSQRNYLSTPMICISWKQIYQNIIHLMYN